MLIGLELKLMVARKKKFYNQKLQNVIPIPKSSTQTKKETKEDFSFYLYYPFRNLSTRNISFAENKNQEP